MATLGDRVREEREAKKWSQAEVARRVSAILKDKVTQVAIHHIEKRGNVNPGFVVELASVLSLKVEYLRTGKGPKYAQRPEVPARSYVGAGDEIFIIPEDQAPIDWAESPPGDDAFVATIVRGRSGEPHYHDGDVLYHSRIDNDPSRYRGEVVVAHLHSGKRYLKILERGNRSGRFKLVSINPDFGAMEDQQVQWVAPIEWHRRRRRK